MTDLGRLYANGKGVAKNCSVAIKWFERAIEKRDRGAHDGGTSRGAKTSTRMDGV